MAETQIYSYEDNLRAMGLLSIDEGELLSLRGLSWDEARDKFGALKKRAKARYRSLMHELHPDQHGGERVPDYDLIRDWWEAFDELGLEEVTGRTMHGAPADQLALEAAFGGSWSGSD